MFEYPNDVRVTSVCRQINGCTNRIGERVIGTKGVAEVDRGLIKGENAWEYKGPEVKPKELDQQVFIKSIREGKPLSEAKAMALSTLGAIMGRMSAYSGRALKWDWALKASKLDMTPPQVRTRRSSGRPGGNARKDRVELSQITDRWDGSGSVCRWSRVTEPRTEQRGSLSESRSAVSGTTQRTVTSRWVVLLLRSGLKPVCSVRGSVTATPAANCTTRDGTPDWQNPLVP